MTRFVRFTLGKHPVLGRTNASACKLALLFRGPFIGGIKGMKISPNIYIGASVKAYISLQGLSHSMARANLKKSVWLVTNTTTASKYIPKRTRICIN